MAVNYSIHPIDKEIIRNLSRCEGEDVLDTLKRLFILYKSFVKRCIENADEQEKLILKHYKRKSYKNCRDLIKIYSEYMNGNLIECNKIVARLFKRTANNLTADHDFPTQIIPKDFIGYRMRDNQKEEKWPPNELFHMSFEGREKIGSNRYSIPGYPCLYIGASIACCVEEISFKKAFSVSACKLNAPAKVFDFTFFPYEEGNDSLSFYKRLVSYPIKIAASLPTMNDDESIKFRPEYIIPQYILHSVIRQKNDMRKRPIGIMYTSVKALEKNVSPENISQYNNLIVPTMKIEKSGYCRELTKLITLTAPQLLRREDIQSIDEWEQCIKQREFYKVEPIKSESL